MLKSISIFEGKKIRKIWDEKDQKWYFSVVDVVGALSDSDRPRKYWDDLKRKLQDEGSELSEKIGQLKMEASDGKYYLTDVADTETIFRIIQSVPSPNAEPFKLWLARVGYERVEEAHDPELAIQRALNTYLKKGYTKEWINQRLKNIEIRKELTDEITFAWAGLTTRDYKKHKGLKQESLRDDMTNLEIVLNMLAEASTVEISKVEKPSDLEANRKVAKEGGSVAHVARKKLEEKTGKSAISDRKHVLLE